MKTRKAENVSNDFETLAECLQSELGFRVEQNNATAILISEKQYEVYERLKWRLAYFELREARHELRQHEKNKMTSVTEAKIKLHYLSPSNAGPAAPNESTWVTPAVRALNSYRRNLQRSLDTDEAQNIITSILNASADYAPSNRDSNLAREFRPWGRLSTAFCVPVKDVFLLIEIKEETLFVLHLLDPDNVPHQLLIQANQ